MSIRQVLVLGHSPHADDLIAQIETDRHANTLRGADSGSAPPDLVVLAGTAESDLAIALRLLESGTPVLLVAGPQLTPATVHRLALVARDAGPTVTCWLPAVDGLEPLDQATEPAPGLRIDRTDNRPAHSMLFDDLAQAIKLVGPFDQVNATLAPQATVTLQSRRGSAATWTLRPALAEPGHTIEVGNQPIPLSENPSAWQPAAEGIGHLTLEELIEVVETMAAIEESARRRRTIDLHHEPTTERTVFKSQMAAVGCLLLMLTLVGLVAQLLLGALFDPTATRAGRADRVGFLLGPDDFLPSSEQLSQDGINQLEQIAGRIEFVQVPVVIAASNDKHLDHQRMASVRQALQQQNRVVAENRIVIDPAPPAWTDNLLRIARMAWIAPLVLFLVLQALILATRGRRNDA